MQLLQDAATHRPRERGKALSIGTEAAATAHALDDRLLIVCGLAWGAGLIHVGAAIEHVSEYALHAVFFGVLAAAQFGWGVALYRRPAPRLLWVGAVASLMVVGLWVASRTSGLPIGPHPWSPEAIGATDVIATADEVVLALVARADILVEGFRPGVAERLGLGPADVLLAITTISFDLAVPDMWLPLVTGARVVVAPTESSRGRRPSRSAVTRCDGGRDFGGALCLFRPRHGDTGRSILGRWRFQDKSANLRFQQSLQRRPSPPPLVPLVHT